MKKIIALVLAFCCVFSFAACTNTNEVEENTDVLYNVRGENKTTINFTSYGGGVGGEWVEIVCEEFAKRNAETSFGDGKQGVFIDINPTMNISLSGLSSTNEHIITSCSNGTPNELANSGEFYNLNDIVKDTSREGGTLESALFSSVVSNLKGNDGNYYGLPHFEYFHGLQYNRKVFNEQRALFADSSDSTAVTFDSKFSNVNFKFTNDAGVLSKGPDGIKGTEDDGLPASMEELLVLMDYFKQRTNYGTPIVVSGACINYTDTIVAGLWAALAGQTQMQNYYNSKGEIQIVKRDGSGNIVYTQESLFPGVDYIKKPEYETIVLDDSNGYLGRDMLARYYAFAFLEIAQKELWFSKEINDTGISHYDAQLALLVGNRISKYSNSAILCEYSYWYNETTNAGTFNKVKLAGMQESDCDARFMCLPTSLYYNAEQIEQPSTLAVANDGYLFVNGNIKNNPDVEKAVVEFVKFLYSDEMLREITVLSGFTRPINYDLTKEEVESLNNYSRRLWNLRKNDGSNVLYNAGDTTGHKLNRASLQLSKTFKGGADYVYQGIKNYGAAEYFVKTALKESSWNVK